MNQKRKRAVVVLSGGQDSAICLALAIKEYGRDKVAAITFEYGQRHAIETKFAKKLVKYFGIDTHKLVKLDFYREITDNALMNGDAAIEEHAGGRGCPNTVVEGRNAIFLQLAAVWAKSLNAKKIYTGVSEADFSGYPDCRESFIRAEQRALRLALDYPIRIITPFMHLNKRDEWKIADDLGILNYIRKHTVTCYRGIVGDGCGECPACKLRNRGLQEYLEMRDKENR